MGSRDWFAILTALVLGLSFVSACSSDDVVTHDFPRLLIDGDLALTASVDENVEGALTITNSGGSTLEATVSVVSGDWLTLSTTELALEPDESEEITASATCHEVGEFTAEYRLESNDPDRDRVTLTATLTCVEGEVIVEPASLTVTVDGLPPDLDADITVEGPDGFEVYLVGGQTLSELEPGEYSVTAAIVGLDLLYLPTPQDPQILTLEPGADESLTITYDLIVGGLTVTFSGLPDGVDGLASVEGPRGFSETIEGDTTLTDLEPGTFEITPVDVADGPAIYTAESVEAEVTSDAHSEVQIDYSVVTGDLAVTVTGLPEGVDHIIDLVADDETSTALPQDGELSDLSPGDYTLAPEPVELDGMLFVANPVEITIESDTTTEATVDYLLDPGSLTITVEGLPDGVDHDLELIDEAGDPTTVPQDGVFSALAPGEYQVVPADIVVDPATYTAQPQTVAVVSDSLAEITVAYSAIPAQWELVIVGVPTGETAAVAVTGPGYDESFSETTSFDDLTPGTYEITPADITSAPAVWRASQTSVELKSGANDATEVHYHVEPGALEIAADGLDGDLSWTATVSAEDSSFNENFSGPRTIEDLPPGDYTVTFHDVVDDPTTYRADPTSTTVTVTSGAVQIATANYQVVPGSMSLQADNLPAELDLSATVVSADGSFDETFHESQTLSALSPGTYTVTFQEVSAGGITYTPTTNTAEQTVVVSSEQTTDVIADYGPNPGSITIATEDLPAHLEPAGTVVSEDGAVSQSFSGEEEIHGLSPGDYTVTFSDVVDDPTTYRADPTSTTVTVTSDTATTATGVYFVVPGYLELESTGLIDLALSATVVSDDSSFEETFFGDQTIGDMVPGDYTVTFHDVVDNGSIYRPDLSSVSVTVRSDQQVSATGDYSLVPGSLTVAAQGLPDDLELQAALFFGEPDEQIIDGAQTLSDLAPGTYEVTFLDVQVGGAIYRPDDTVVSVDVESEADPTPVAQTHYSVVYGDLAVTATGLDGETFTAHITGENFDETVTGPTTLEHLTPGEYTVTFQIAEHGLATYEPLEDFQVIEVEVESEKTITAEGHYELVLADLVVSVDFPTTVSFDLEVVRDGSVEDTAENVEGGELIYFNDLPPGDYLLRPSSAIVDEWGNAYLDGDLSGINNVFPLPSGIEDTRSISGLAPSVVRHDGDDGVSSLREVVGRVNAGTVVTFASAVSTVTLTSGQIAIDRSLSVVGDDDGVAIVAQGAHRIFDLAEDTELTLQSLRLSGGQATGDAEAGDGGAIYSQGSLTLFEVELHDNLADSNGGAVYGSDTSELTLHNVVARDNTSGSNGGAVLIRGPLVAQEVAFFDNEASFEGGAIVTHVATTISEARFERNSSGSFGGAVVFYSHLSSSLSPEMILDRSLFVGNTSVSGGAIDSFISDVLITNSTFYANEANSGGGIFSSTSGSVTVRHATFVDNTAGTGPAIRGGDNLVLGASLIAENGDGTASEVTTTGTSTAISEGYNFITAVDDESFIPTSTDEVGSPDAALDARLEGFGYHSANLQTFALDPTSPAYQMIPAGDCLFSIDQRGFTRPVDDQCTPGAWQADANLEDFELAPLSGSYGSESFTGNGGITWNYEAGLHTTSSTRIDTHGIVLAALGASQGDGRLWAETIPGGVDRITFNYRKAFEGGSDRRFDVLINGDLVASSPVFGGFSGADDTVYTLSLDDLDLSDDFSFEIRNQGAQVTIDNIRWE